MSGQLLTLLGEHTCNSGGMCLPSCREALAFSPHLSAPTDKKGKVLPGLSPAGIRSLLTLSENGVGVSSTLRASLSGTFFQTLPDLVTPLKGHSLSPRSCPPARSAPSERY